MSSGCCFIRLTGFALATGIAAAQGVNCSLTADPDGFLDRETRSLREVQETIARYSWGQKPGLRRASLPASELPRRTLVDVHILGRLQREGVAPAPLSGDEEFLRRVTLDLTGRLPSAAEVREFTASGGPEKRQAAIDRLLESEAFDDKWTMWMGDLLQLTANSSNVNRQIFGRDAFYIWLRTAMGMRKSFKDIAVGVVTANGNSFDGENGAANFIVGATTPMGPTQDNFDTMLSKTATAFLGNAYWDCILCHNGRRHLDSVSLWGSQATRTEAWRMAAFFSRMRFPRSRAPQGDPMFNSFDVSEAATGQYDLNTTAGNRPARQPIGAMRNVTPEYYGTMAVPRNGNWREAFAENLVRDPNFARNFANRVWKQFFSLALVEPVDTLDPLRLDPKNPPPAPWKLQASHPELLEELAAAFVELNYDIRQFMRLLVSSTAYQLSASYPGEWKFEYTTLYARHYPRRLDGEEIHDAIAQATGMMGNYTVSGRTWPTLYAMQLPDSQEPRSNGAVAAFMNFFLRGNRDTQPRAQNSSIQQRLGLMNDNFVSSRMRVAASPVLRAAAAMSNPDAVDEIWLNLLSRRPTAHERERAVAHLQRAGNATARNTAIEDLAWVAVNQNEFVFSY